MICIKKEELTPTTWSGGKTWTYFMMPQTATLAARDFDIRISSASVEIEHSIFSDYRGYTRYFSVLTNPITLSINGVSQRVDCATLVKFDGADQVTSYGKTVDVNIFVKHGIKAKIYRHSGLVVGPCAVFADENLFLLQRGESKTFNDAICIEM